MLMTWFCLVGLAYTKHCRSVYHENEYVTYQWDKTQVSAQDYIRGYCRMRCQGAIRIDLSSSDCWNMDCFPCYCQRPACEIFDNCCPDISVPYWREGSHTEGVYNRTESSLYSPYGVAHKVRQPNVKCDYLNTEQDNYMYIGSCLADYVENQTLAELCERFIAPKEETLETYLRVVDMTTHLIYRNMFCALCNHVTNVSQSLTHKRRLMHRLDRCCFFYYKA